MKKLIVAFAFVLFAALTYGAYSITVSNNVVVEKFDDKPKKEAENTEATTQEAKKEQPKQEQKAEEKKACSETETKSSCTKEQKSSCCKKN
jgi:hypothetical protein